MPRALLWIVLAAGQAGHLCAQTSPNRVEIVVTVGPGGRAHVSERYELPPRATPLEFRLLARPFAQVGAVRVDRADVGLVVTEERDGPWTVLRNGQLFSEADPLDLTVGYDVRLTGPGTDIPLAHLTSPIPQLDGEREGNVHVTVRFTGDPGRVDFPQMEQESGAEWRARYAAIPSFVGVSLSEADRAAAGDCPGGGEAPGDDGGLVWRFLLLVGIMVAWVPIYLAWARRSGEDAG